MNHNASAMLAIDPRLRNGSIYQKTLGINDFYFSDGADGAPLGNVQLLGKITGPILKANKRAMPTPLLSALAAYSFDWYLMSEDLPHPDSRVRLDGGQIVLDWRRSNIRSHARLIEVMRERFRAAGFPIVLSRTFDRRTPSHQCGTIRFGRNPADSALDIFCRAHDHPNLYRGRCILPADFGRSEPGTHHRRHGASRGGSHPARTSPRRILRGGKGMSASATSSRPVAVVTGGGRGIGRAIALELARAGFDLALPLLDPDCEEAFSVREAIGEAGAGVLLLKSDLADVESHPATAEAVADGYGRLDVIVNNAGIGAVVRGDLLYLTPENYDTVMGINLRGTLFFTQACPRVMLRLGDKGTSRSRS